MLSKISRNWAARVIVAATLALSATAQTAPPVEQSSAKKPDSPEAAGHVAKAKKIAGAEWPNEAHFFCEAPAATDANAPEIEPAKIFDNVYVMGRASTVTYAITTPTVAIGTIVISFGSTVAKRGLMK